MDQKHRPTIGVNADCCPLKDGGDALVLPTAYTDCLVGAGARPVILPPVDDLDSLPLAMLDGIMLIGGPDYNPRVDGWQLHHTTRLMSGRREAFDRTLCHRVANLRLPVLAIGAGMQLLNLTCGGNLFLHIPEDKPRAMPHSDPTDPLHRHAIEVVPESLVGTAYGTWGWSNGIKKLINPTAVVTSQHHQAVDDVAPGFHRTAWASDGVTEAIESTDPEWLAVGVQWHPESRHATAIEAGLFGVWVEAVAARWAKQIEAVDSLTGLVITPDPPGPVEEWWTRRQAAEFLGVQPGCLEQRARRGEGPPYRSPHEGRAVEYRADDIRDLKASGTLRIPGRRKLAS
jgi:putative glutamine amidotransferase